MRYSMGLLPGLPNPGVSDMDGSGVIDISDALLIMRMSMGLAE